MLRRCLPLAVERAHPCVRERPTRVEDERCGKRRPGDKGRLRVDALGRRPAGRRVGMAAPRQPLPPRVRGSKCSCNTARTDGHSHPGRGMKSPRRERTRFHRSRPIEIPRSPKPCQRRRQTARTRRGIEPSCAHLFRGAEPRPATEREAARNEYSTVARPWRLTLRGNTRWVG